ncbi:MAG: efflux transporter periplasmic adaptor subunit [Flavobacteriaceae bacterium]|nr:efflux transporter periplasmic adaptor subunit [Flavobacteriaceae bacterium]|tara:strand:- start:508627 stop:509793 length:1167 start_codon:yes stop_codon:yes gene_type:complete
MKTTYYTLLLAFLFLSCGGNETSTVEDIIASNDLKTIRQKRTDLDKAKQNIDAQIKQLNAAIEKLDTLKRNPLVTALTIEQQVFNHYLELQGNVKTKQNVLVYPETPGTLEKIFVKEGQYVKKGQVLAKIDDGGLAQQVAQLEATTALAKTTFERQAKLWEQKIGSEIQYLQTKTNYTASKNQLEQLKKQFDKYNLKAPFSGVIDDVIKEQGTVVAPGPGSEVFRIVNLSNMYIEADIPETYIPYISKGKEVEIEFPVLGKTVKSTVRQTGNFINPANRTFKVEIGVPNSEKSIKPNLTAKLKINDYTSDNAILIPQSIISENANGDQYVYLIAGMKDSIGVAKQTVVKTGKTQGDFIEILDGISAGDQLIEEGARSIKNGQSVKVTN